MEIILIFIWAGVLISLLCDRRIRKITEEVMDYGTKGQTGEQAVRLFLKEMGGKMKIKYDFHSMFDYYDIKSETLNICSLSKNSSSLYFYCHALRQIVFGIRGQKKKKLYALKTAFLMLLRISGPVMLVLLLNSGECNRLVFTSDRIQSGRTVYYPAAPERYFPENPAGSQRHWIYDDGGYDSEQCTYQCGLPDYQRLYDSGIFG